MTLCALNVEPKPLTPSERAYLEILELPSRPELRTEVMLGGPLPPEMVAENNRRLQERRRQKFAIIAKYNVFDEYLKPLREKEILLSNELKNIQEDIADLEKLKA